ncbi:MAG TPA: hypothetical protein VGM87_06890 [Roseomonas sp.]
MTDLERFMASKTYALVPIYGFSDHVRYLIAERDPAWQQAVILPGAYDTVQDAAAAKAAMEEAAAAGGPTPWRVAPGAARELPSDSLCPA